jgi:hypothetical protein
METQSYDCASFSALFYETSATARATTASSQTRCATFLPLSLSISKASLKSALAFDAAARARSARRTFLIEFAIPALLYLFLSSFAVMMSSLVLIKEKLLKL